MATFPGWGKKKVNRKQAIPTSNVSGYVADNEMAEPFTNKYWNSHKTVIYDFNYPLIKRDIINARIAREACVDDYVVKAEEIATYQCKIEVQ